MHFGALVPRELWNSPWRLDYLDRAALSGFSYILSNLESSILGDEPMSPLSSTPLRLSRRGAIATRNPYAHYKPLGSAYVKIHPLSL